jgi:amino acid transporter
VFTNNTLVSWGNSFQTNNTWILIAALAIVLLQTLILLRGTKATFRWQNASFGIAMSGTILAYVVLLVGSRHGFVANLASVNHKFGGGGAAAIISQAKAGSVAPDLGNLNATLPTLFSIQGFMMWNFWSVYMSGELKSASNRRRQLSIMFSALIWDVALLVIGAQLLFRIAGYNLIYALNLPSPAYKIPSGPFYQFLAALVFNTPVLSVLILGTFLFWALPSMIANTFMPIRSFFAWSFDRLMPEGLANVSERTHSPVNAIVTANVIIAAVVIWSVYSHSFQLVLGMIVLAGALAVIIVSVAAIALPRRRPDLYQASPANASLWGVPVLSITGVLSIIEFGVLIWVSLKYPALVMNGNPANWWWVPLFFASLIAAGLLIYYVPRYLRQRQGVNINFVYRELPPE